MVDELRTRPTEAEMDAFMAQQFGTGDTAAHDPQNPEHVTRELMKPFPQNALYQRNKFTYVQYQQVIRRLIHATGNAYTTEVKDLRIEPWTQSSGGHQQVILMATVTLTIPVLQSSRTHTGVQVATVGFGEDMWKGAISDGIKKAAQQFGVAIDLAGADGEDTAPHDPGLEMAKDIGVVHQSATRAPQRQQAPAPQQTQNAPQRAPQQATGASGGKRTDTQGKALWKISGANRDVLAGWCAEFGVSNDRDLTEEQAGQLIMKYGEPQR